MTTAAKSNITAISESKTMARHSMIYGVGNIFNRMIGFLMLPVYTRYLVPAEYGTLELVALTTELAGMLLSMRISRAMYRFYFEYDNEADKNQVISTAMIFFGMFGFVCVLTAMQFSRLMASTILDNADLSYYFNLSFFSLWFNTLVLMGFDCLQIKKRSKLYIVFSALKLFTNLTLNICFVVVFKMGVFGILLGNLLSSGLFTLALVLPTIFKAGLVFSTQKAKAMLAYGLPLIPGSIANFIVLVSDRYIVKVFGSLADAGIYALSYKFGTLPHQLITVPFFQIWSVRRFELHKDAQSEEAMGRVITYYMFVIMFIGLGISVLATDTLRIMADEKYWAAGQYIPLLILAYIVFGQFNHFVANILIQKKTKYLSYIDIGNGILNISLNIVMIRTYGIWGAAWATFISYTFRIAAIYIVSRQMGPVTFEFGRAGQLLLAAVVIYAICQTIQLSNAAAALCVKTAIAFTFPLLLFSIRFFNSEELAFIKRKALDVRSQIGSRLMPK